MFRPGKGETWGQYCRRSFGVLFPERHLMVRTEGRVRYLRIGRYAQVFCVGLLTAGAAWVGYATVNVMLHEAVLADKNNQVASARLAYRSLLTEVTDYQSKFGELSEELESSHLLMLGLVEKNASLQQDLKTVETRLKTTEKERTSVAHARQSLKQKLSGIETRLQDMASHNFSLRDNLTKHEEELQRAVAERKQLVNESDQLRESKQELETLLAEIETKQTKVVQRLGDQALSSIGNYESVIAMTGIDVEKLLKLNAGEDIGMGGPFVEAVPDNRPAAELRSGLQTLDMKLNRIAVLQDVMAKVPLAAPLDSYYITSSFGKRRDPMNKRWAMHYGVDMGAARKAPIYATAPGVVTFAGWKGNYGRFIEIDHGAGIKTRYGHLNKILVKKGDQIEFRDKIGLLGNSGRSTGAHLHYEIKFQNKAHNPMNFIKAGQYVFQE